MEYLPCEARTRHSNVHIALAALNPNPDPPHSTSSNSNLRTTIRFYSSRCRWYAANLGSTSPSANNASTPSALIRSPWSCAVRVIIPQGLERDSSTLCSMSYPSRPVRRKTNIDPRLRVRESPRAPPVVANGGHRLPVGEKSVAATM